MSLRNRQERDMSKTPAEKKKYYVVRERAVPEVLLKVVEAKKLLEQMLEAAESLLDKEKYYYLMCTIHPDNEFSRNNMESHGYKVKKIALCYGGLPRCILLKNLRKC